MTCTLAVTLLAGTLAACSGGESASGGAKGDVKKGSPVTLKIELFDRGNTPSGAPPLTESYFVKYMQEKFGDPNNIKQNSLRYREQKKCLSLTC